MHDHYLSFFIDSLDVLTDYHVRDCSFVTVVLETLDYLLDASSNLEGHPFKSILLQPEYQSNFIAKIIVILYIGAKSEHLNFYLQFC
jgi:hypothetical protein